jgi:[acyl-carrier-protein] S-malonyltransferase
MPASRPGSLVDLPRQPAAAVISSYTRSVGRLIRRSSPLVVNFILFAGPIMAQPTNSNDLQTRIKSSAFAFRGYNTTNLSRTPELLAHPRYGPIVGRWLDRMSQLCSDVLKEPVDLAARVRSEADSRLETFGQDVGLIFAVELAQLECLAECHGIEFKDTKFSFGYSLGEGTAVVASGVFKLEDLVEAPLMVSRDCAELARDVTMGVVFSRDAELDLEGIERLCVEISQEGEGLLAISTYLSPNTLLVLGQGRAIDRFKMRLREEYGKRVHLRKNPDRWPPLHTRLLWERNIPNRAAWHMCSQPGGLTAPNPPVLSCVTGQFSYNEHNSRDLLNRWIDHPQRLWDVVYETLSSGVELIVHVGPGPNLIPATFRRIADNVSASLAGRSLGRLGGRAVTRFANRPWLTKLLPSRAALLRAPFVDHIILEDWLLDHEPV